MGKINNIHTITFQASAIATWASAMTWELHSDLQPGWQGHHCWSHHQCLLGSAGSWCQEQELRIEP